MFPSWHNPNQTFSELETSRVEFQRLGFYLTLLTIILNKLPFFALYERLGNQVRTFSSEDIRCYGQALAQATKTCCDFQPLCSSSAKEGEKPVIHRGRFFKECCPNPTPFFVSYQFNVDLFSVELMAEIGQTARRLVHQERASSIEMLPVHATV